MSPVTPAKAALAVAEAYRKADVEAVSRRKALRKADAIMRRENRRSRARIRQDHP